MIERVLRVGEVTTTIAIEPGLRQRLGSLLRASGNASRVLLVTDQTVDRLYGGAAKSVLQNAGWAFETFVLPPGETSKSLAFAERLYQQLARQNFGRDGMIVALGGGVVSDLAGFVAATWMRGVTWVICPTTLEAMIDAAIGGKTAVNVPGGKNLVGAFHHPAMVLIDPQFLGTLPDRDYCAGLAESVKHAAVFAPDFFMWHEQNAEAILQREPAAMNKLIERNVAIKADVVEKDATELTGHRMLLNFGHTIGHAIEECSGFDLRHGECVALGMIAACRHSQSLGLLEATVADRVANLLNRLQLPTRLPCPGATGGLPASAGDVRWPRFDWPQILDVMRRDKKVRDGKLQFVLLKDLGSPIIRNNIDEELVRRAFEALPPDG